MKSVKKKLVLILVCAMIISILPAFAETFKHEEEAAKLNTIGLYAGISETEFNPDLGTSLDRQTGVVMLLKMFGQEDEAKLLTDEQANTILAKFSDGKTIANWAKKQVAYAVDKGVVKGYAEDSTFKPNTGLNGKAYASLLLQQLGYDGDFNYQTAAMKLGQIVGLNAEQATIFNTDDTIIKDSLVGMSYGTLQAKMKNSGKPLVKVLIEKGAITKENLEKAKITYDVVTSVDAIADINVKIGGTPTLPNTVKATFDNGTTTDVAVNWPTVDTSGVGEQTITGTIANTTVTVTVKVIVEKENETEIKKVSYASGKGTAKKTEVLIENISKEGFSVLVKSNKVPITGLGDDNFKLMQGEDIIPIELIVVPDMDGQYSISAELLPDTVYTLIFTKQGYKQANVEVRTPIDVTISAQDISTSGFTILVKKSGTDIAITGLEVDDFKLKQEETISIELTEVPDMDGQYSISASLLAGEYTLEFTKEGYKEKSIDITVTED